MPTLGFATEASTGSLASFVQAVCPARAGLQVGEPALCTPNTSANAFDRGGSQA